MIQKWRKDANNISHFDLLKLVLDESGYSGMLKNKKDLENEIGWKILKSCSELCKTMKAYRVFRTCCFSYLNRSRVGRCKNKFDDITCS